MSEHSGIRFKIGEAFPPEDPLARWMTICAMALNDLLYVNRHLFPRLKEEIESEDYENVYFARLAGAHLFEVGKFLEKSDRIEVVREFVRGLTDDEQAAYEKVKSVGPRGTSEFAEQLETARNQFFHYSELVQLAEDHEALKTAMNKIAGEEGEIEDGGVPITNFRATFADGVGVRLSIPDPPDREEFVSDISEHIAAYLKFAFAAIPAYVQRLPGESWEYIDRE
jgi:hypothetical protein